MPPDGSLSRGASTLPSGCWGDQLVRRPHLDPLPGNGEAGLLRQVGGTLLLVGGGLAPSLRENLIGYICGSRDPVASSYQ